MPRRSQVITVKSIQQSPASDEQLGQILKFFDALLAELVREQIELEESEQVKSLRSSN